ncbi:hypothetical protein [Synechococcus phage S-B68]|nr:hypothetical protein [Synechococcus phage S-B68]
MSESKYMVIMGCGPETYEDHLHKTISNLLMTVRFLQRGDDEKAKYWMYNLVLPSLEEVYTRQDKKFGVYSESELHRKGEYDWDLILRTHRKEVK